MFDADFIVVARNQSHFTKLCIESILKNIDQPYHLIVVDNGSSDDTHDYLATIKSRIPKDSKITIVFNKENTGYAGGLNKGLEHSKAKYVLFCNNDIEFYPRSLREMIRIAESNERFGLVNPNSNEFEMKSFNPEKLAELQGRSIERCHTSGFCVLVKRTVIEKIGGIDMEFAPAYFEDMDYAERAKQAGFLCAVALGGYVYHYGTRTFLSDEKERLWQQNEKLFRSKWGGTKWFGCALRATELSDVDTRKEIIAKLLEIARKEIAVIYIYIPTTYATYFQNIHNSFRILPTLFGLSGPAVFLRAMRGGNKKMSRIFVASENCEKICKHLKVFHRAEVINLLND